MKMTRSYRQSTRQPTKQGARGDKRNFFDGLATEAEEAVHRWDLKTFYQEPVQQIVMKKKSLWRTKKHKALCREGDQRER